MSDLRKSSSEVTFLPTHGSSKVTFWASWNERFSSKSTYWTSQFVTVFRVPQKWQNPSSKVTFLATKWFCFFEKFEISWFWKKFEQNAKKHQPGNGWPKMSVLRKLKQYLFDVQEIVSFEEEFLRSDILGQAGFLQSDISGQGRFLKSDISGQARRIISGFLKSNIFGQPEILFQQHFVV